MAHLQSSHIIISRRLFTESKHGFKSSIKDGKIEQNSLPRTWKIQIHSGRYVINKTGFGYGGVQCCSTSSSSSTTTDYQYLGMIEKTDQMGRESQGLVREHGWKVRRMVEEGTEMRKVAQIQAEAFHIPTPFFNQLFFQFFQAEVLSGLLYRLRNSSPDRYACLVAVPASNVSAKSQQGLVGVVDVTVSRDEEVLEHLPGAAEYLYVSGIAVSNSYRRQKVATVLLKACERICVIWGHEYLVLRAYEDDWGARALYANAGYRVVSGDPTWVAWVGRKRRILMIKRSTFRD
ncbi:hypothetical protein Ancab_036683 [Ancistrocladus abbreviatus]